MLYTYWVHCPNPRQCLFISNLSQNRYNVFLLRESTNNRSFLSNFLQCVQDSCEPLWVVRNIQVNYSVFIFNSLKATRLFNLFYPFHWDFLFRIQRGYSLSNFSVVKSVTSTINDLVLTSSSLCTFASHNLFTDTWTDHYIFKVGSDNSSFFPTNLVFSIT